MLMIIISMIFWDNVCIDVNMRDHSSQTSGQRSSLSTPLPRACIVSALSSHHPSLCIRRKCGNKRQVNKLFPSVPALEVLFPKTKQHIAAQPIL